MILAASAEHISTAIATIVALGVAGQWVAGRLRLPSVLVLLLLGIVIGPVSGAISPDEDLGPALFPAVSMAVGLLLFEGGLSLRLSRLAARSVVVRLVTIGALVTWIVASVAVWLLFDLGVPVSALIGAILVVSGPTVVIPLLHLARPREPAAGILRWEGIIIDPIGATLAIVVLEATIDHASPGGSAAQVLATLGSGTLVGIAGAAIAVTALRFHAVPDRLHNPFLLAVVVSSYAVANELQPEGGLMAATVMGVALANQRWVPAREIRAFSEDLGHVLLGTLFITLGALVDIDDVAEVLPRAIPLVAILVVVARPLAVLLSTWRTDVPRNDRWYLAAMAPRGIVAAAVSTVFANTLAAETGRPVPELVPIVFAVVITTVALYGLSAAPLARVLRVAKPHPTGLAIVSNHPIGVELADLVAAGDVTVLLVSTSHRRQVDARRRGIVAYDQPLDDDELDLVLDGLGIGQALLLTDDADLASHAGHHLTAHLGRANVRHVVNEGGSAHTAAAFGPETFESLTRTGVELHRVDAAELAEDEVPLVALGAPGVTLLHGTRPSEGSVIAVRRRPATGTGAAPAIAAEVDAPRSDDGTGDHGAPEAGGAGRGRGPGTAATRDGRPRGEGR